MATVQNASRRRNRRSQAVGGDGRLARGKWIVALVALVVLAWYWTSIRTQARYTAAFAARTACSCRYLDGRSLDSCEADLGSRGRFTALGEDEAEKSVSARIPFLASDTARFREGSGCLLETWNE